MKKSYWIVRVPELTLDRVNVTTDANTMERDAPVIVVPTLYMLYGDDQEEALFAAICQVMPKRSHVARPKKESFAEILKWSPCAGMGRCYWRQGAGWFDEPVLGGTYYDPFDLLKKTPFLYKV